MCSLAFNDHISNVDAKLESFILDIVKIPHTNDKSILNSVYKKIVFYIILNSGLGTPDKPNVWDETKSALSSVFHFYAVKPFLKKSSDEKREQLQQLTNIVMGIRLFFWHHGEYGHGIENIPDALEKGLNKSIHDLLKRIMSINEQAQKLTDALWYHYRIICKYSKNYDKDYSSPSQSPIENDFKPEQLDDVKFVKCTINTLHECIKFLHDILNVLKHAQHDVSKTIGEFHEALVDLQKFTKYKNKYIVTEFVPTEMAVHKFINIASLWKKLWKYLVSVHLLNDLEESLSLTIKDMKLPSQDFMDYLSNTFQGLNQHQYLEHIDESKLDNPQCKLVEFSLDVPLKFEGFSPLILILEGFLVRGKPDLGVIQYNDEFYSFSSPEEAYVFCEEAEKYSLMLVDSVRQRPELIDFFHMKDSLYSMKQLNVTMRPKMCDSGIQTEVHPIKQFFDSNYHFNTYELMRRHWKKTQSYLNSENKATKTCSLSEVSTQTYDKESSSTQECDKATSMPRPFHYVLGLRGYNNDTVLRDKDYVPLLKLEL